MNSNTNLLGITKTRFEWLAIFIGPLLYFAMLALPLGGTVTQQGGLAIIVWAAWYWATGCVPTGYVMAVPIFGTAFLPGMKFGAILQTLVHPGLPMLLGPALIVCMWSRWGFTRRLALYALSKVGTSVRAQAVTWLLLATAISTVAANVVIAIALTPIALEILKSVGYDSPSKLLRSKSAMLIIIAVGIGASLGGFLTPMAGGQAVITWQQLSTSLGYDVPMASFTASLILPVLLSTIPATLLFAYVFPVDSTHFSGSVEYFKEQLAEMGPLSKSELWGVVIFIFAIALPFLQPVWQPYMPKSININPALIFATITCILAVLPAPDKGAAVTPFPFEPGERLLGLKSIKILPLQAFLIWPTAMSIATLVDMTGAGSLMAGFLGTYWTQPPYVGVGLFVILCGILGNVASDTGAAGMLAPIIAAATSAAGENPVPWLLMMGYTVNFSFMVPTATGTMALPIALGGKASWRLPVYGFCCAVGCCFVSWLFWGAVMTNKWTFFTSL
ncbi:MAG: SLC13 family permease [Desulfovibrionaceae bacterium]|nr:SLC13 family permease [Desulfovibrionaceae bacterium]